MDGSPEGEYRIRIISFDCMAESSLESLFDLEYDKAVIKCQRTSRESERQMGF